MIMFLLIRLILFSLFEHTGKLKLNFQEGLEDKLAAHIARRHAADISDRNAGLAINLTEAAFRALARRAVQVVKTHTHTHTHTP